jgi:hypothetical protein
MHPSLTRKFCAVATLAFTLGSAQAAELDPQPLKPQLQQLIAQMYPQMRGIYEDLHANPELGFQETRTAAKLAAEMRKLGFEVTEGIGKTGLVAIYRNGAGPTVMVRTELDALPMEEKTGLPYASKAKAQYNGKESFVAHSCGHDMHMTSWLGTAQALLGLKKQWKGTLMFVAQPSEETVTGAKAMLADGLFQKFGKPDYAFALHTGSMPYGTVGYVAGGDLQFGLAGHHVSRPRQPWLHARQRHRPRAHGLALRGGCARRDQPRERSHGVRRGHRGRLQLGQRGQYHSRPGAAARNNPQLQERGAHKNARRH